MWSLLSIFVLDTYTNYAHVIHDFIYLKKTKKKRILNHINNFWVICSVKLLLNILYIYKMTIASSENLEMDWLKTDRLISDILSIFHTDYKL